MQTGRKMNIQLKIFAALASASILSACAQQSAEVGESTAASPARAAVDAVYAGFAAGDIELAVSTMSSDIEWREAEGNPYADNTPSVGPDAVVGGLFARLGGEWEGFAATPEETVAEGDRVVVFGRYGGTYLATGKQQHAPFVHSWTVKDGKIVSFQQYTDTAAMVAAMTADED